MRVGNVHSRPTSTEGAWVARTSPEAVGRRVRTWRRDERRFFRHANIVLQSMALSVNTKDLGSFVWPVESQ